MADMDADDFFVVIVGEQEKHEDEFISCESDIKEEIYETILQADKLPAEFYEKIEFRGDFPFEFDVKIEPIDGSQEASSEDIDETDERTKRQRRSLLKPRECRSYINELREQYPELNADEDLLITVLCDIMRTVKPPAPPQDYIIENDTVFECVKCGALTNTLPAASRHYQHKHGPHYLVCFACGVDFRSTTYLYKHEQRCLGPDATIMLKARALYLGRKGRSRPYLKEHKFKLYDNPTVKRVRRRYIETADKSSKAYHCTQCIATFTNNVSLESHMHLHSGSRPYQCDQCPAAYTSKPALMQHTRKHTGVEYICDYCKRSFKAKKTLVVHIDIHKPLRKYWCEQCGCRYAQKTALTAHINRKHLNLPPAFACSLCTKRYCKNSTLKDHMKKEHKLSLITRYMFKRKLPTLSEVELDEAKKIFDSDLTNINDVLMNDLPEDDSKANVKPKLKKRIKRKKQITKAKKDEAGYMETGQHSMEELQCNVDAKTVIKKLNSDIVVKKVKDVQNIKKRRQSRDTVKFFAIQPMDDLVTLKDNVKRNYRPNSKPKKVYLSNIHKSCASGNT